MTFSRRLALGLLAAALCAPAALAQSNPDSPYNQGNPDSPYNRAYRRRPPVSEPPGSGLQSDAGASASLARTPPPPPPPQQQYQPPPPQDPGYYPPYQPYIESPAHGYLSGVAEVTTANGQYLSQVQQARLQQSQADMAKLDFRLKFAEQQRYLKSLEPTPEELRQKDIRDAINRSRNNPPPTEIWSGRALNDLFVAIQRASRDGTLGPAVPLDPQMLRHINLTTGNTTAGAGMLKELKHFQWPLALLDDPFNENRTKVEALSRQAVEQASSGPVDPRLSRDLQRAINDLIATVKARVNDITPTQYVQAMRYLRELNDSVKVLQDPNAANYFTDKYQATGNTVAELIQGMSGRGLTFAPAASGDEPFYTALHGALVSYDYGLRQVAGR
jgi:hypothetical protein